MAAISARRIVFSYKIGSRRHRVLRDFDVEIDSGDIVAIQGPSGSGKSTLLYLLSGLLQPESGDVVVSERHIYSLSEENLAYFRSEQIGFVFQQFHLLPKASVLDNILLAAKYPSEGYRDMKAAEARARELAGRMGLEEHLDHRPNQLSGGQQQRVAICRALLNNPEIILADEPTGNLDSRSAAQIMEILKEIHGEGKTIVIITHDGEIARQCDRVITMRDGHVEADVRRRDLGASRSTPQSKHPGSSSSNLLRFLKHLSSDALSNLAQQKPRAALTMLGVVIGVAAMLAMISFGQFVQTRILSSYETLGVNKVMLRGYPNWQLEATEQFSVIFDGFDWNADIRPLQRIFPEIELVSPLHRGWSSDVQALGNSMREDVSIYGINPEYLAISQRGIIKGLGFSSYHLERASSVCLIGIEIARGLFSQVDPIGQMISIAGNETKYTCEVLGVLESARSNSEWDKPDYHIYVPSSFFRQVSGVWESKLNQVVIKVKSGHDIESFANAAANYFDLKYGRSGRFLVDNDAVMVSQLKQFLNFFKLLLAAIAAVSLLVGGIGITNMMLASLSEQTKEIGVRKALGATNKSIRWQYLSESIILCSLAGLVGLVLGFGTYQAVIYLAAQLVPQLGYEWIIVPWAFVLSFASILLVGVGSGLIPALRAEKLQVIDALRTS